MLAQLARRYFTTIMLLPVKLLVVDILQVQGRRFWVISVLPTNFQPLSFPHSVPCSPKICHVFFWHTKKKLSSARLLFLRPFIFLKKLATLRAIHCLSLECHVYKSSILMMLVQSELLRLICCKNEWP